MTCSPSCDCPHRFPRWLILRALIWLYLGIIITPPLPHPPPQKKTSTGQNPGPKRKAVFASAIKSNCPHVDHDKIADCLASTDLKLYPLPKSQHTLLSLFYLSIPPPPPPPNSKASVEFYCKTAGFYIIILAIWSHQQVIIPNCL